MSEKDCGDQGCPLCQSSRGVIVILLAAAIAVTFWLKSENGAKPTPVQSVPCCGGVPLRAAPSDDNAAAASEVNTENPSHADGVPGSADGVKKELAASTGAELPETEKVDATAVTEKRVPILVELGSDKCIPCKAMAPIIDALREEFAGRMSVVFINVRTNPADASAFDITSIPTQVFLDAKGEELMRHTGPISREGILKAWESVGVTFEPVESVKSAEPVESVSIEG